VYRSGVRLRPSLRAVLGVLLLVAAVLAAPTAVAAPADAAVTKEIEKVLAEDYAQAGFGEAKRKITASLERCKRQGCSPAVRAQALVVLGMVQSQVGQTDDARNNFVAALNDDPAAKLPAATTPTIRNLWKEAVEKAKPAPPPEPPPEAAPVATPVPAPPATGPAEPPPPEPTPTGPAPSGAGSRIPGWVSPEAFQEASAGLAADTAGKLDECIKHDKASLELEDQPRTRLHLASCQSRSGKLLDALGDAHKALQAGIKKRDALVIEAARRRIKDLIPKIPHVTFVAPSGVENLSVSFDDRDVPNDALTKKFSIDPGEHTVKAGGVVNNIEMSFEKTFQVKPGELLTVQLELRPPLTSKSVVTPGQIACMMKATTQEEVQKCLPQSEKGLVVRASSDLSAYSDSVAVQVLSPRINGSLTSPTQGWNVGVNYLIDVFTAASPDIVSYASPRYKETRHAVALSGGYKPGLYGVTAGANMSREPDYLSLSANVAFTADLRDKLVTPRLAFSYSHDTIGFKSLDPPYLRPFDTLGIDAGVTLVMSPTVVLILNLTAQLERGDQSKPYRFVPFFDEAVAARVPRAASINLVNDNRLSVRANEQLPTKKDRFALGVRLAKRFASSTLRIEERLYFDNWGTKASTTDARLVFDVGRRLRVWPHLRIHAQTGVSFYQLAYVAAVDPGTGAIALPLYRTGDRELSPLVTATGGGGMRWGLTAPESKTQWALVIQSDVMLSYYFNLLFLSSRTALYGSLGVEAEFE